MQKKDSECKHLQIWKLHLEGLTYEQIAAKVRFHPVTVQVIVNKQRQKYPPEIEGAAAKKFVEKQLRNKVSIPTIKKQLWRIFRIKLETTITPVKTKCSKKTAKKAKCCKKPTKKATLKKVQKSFAKPKAKVKAVAVTTKANAKTFKKEVKKLEKRVRPTTKKAAKAAKKVAKAPTKCLCTKDVLAMIRKFGCSINAQ